jgi:hypothetical protein
MRMSFDQFDQIEDAGALFVAICWQSGFKSTGVYAIIDLKFQKVQILNVELIV